MDNYDSIYSKVMYNVGKKLLTITWNENTETMDEDTFKRLLSEKLNLVKKYRPLMQLVDTQKFLFVIEPEMQEWISQRVFSQYEENGMRKLAFIQSEDYFAEMSLQQSIEEYQGKILETRYFLSLQEANAWLMV